MKKRRSILCLLAAMCVVLAACGSGNGESEVRGLTIGTADSGGTMYPVGKAIAKVITEDTTTGISMNVNASTGSAMNVQALADGNIDLGLVTGDVAYEATVAVYNAILRQEGLRPRTAVDLACGTGSVAVLLARQGLRVTGVDLSEDMLPVAW